MNEKFEQYISDLSPELQEKARECKTQEELNAFIAENDLELPEDALELVAGGCGTCKHDSDKKLENWVSIGSTDPVIRGKKVGSIGKNCCSKCGGNITYTAHTGNIIESGRYYVKVETFTISEAEFNTYKSQFRLQWKA
ncbi:MAG: hypothetical protein IJM75_01205 [Ruminococcus sp.]|nr:hypothetical protein [Ruminococcus sp.]